MFAAVSAFPFAIILPLLSLVATDFRKRLHKPLLRESGNAGVVDEALAADPAPQGLRLRLRRIDAEFVACYHVLITQ